MFSFKDASGKEWEWPKITGRVLSELRDVCKLDMREILRKGNAEAIGLALADDEIIRGAVVRLLKLSKEDADMLEDAWDGETNRAARESLVEAFFTFSHGPTRAKNALEKMKEAGL